MLQNRVHRFGSVQHLEVLAAEVVALAEKVVEWAVSTDVQLGGLRRDGLAEHLFVDEAEVEMREEYLQIGLARLDQDRFAVLLRLEPRNGHLPGSQVGVASR